MVTLFRRWRLQFVFAGVLLPVLPAYADDEAVIRLGQHEPAGVVRMNPGAGTVVRGQSPQSDDATVVAASALELANCEMTDVSANGGWVDGQGVGAAGDVMGGQGYPNGYTDGYGAQGYGGQVYNGAVCPDGASSEGVLSRKLSAIRGRHAAAGEYGHGHGGHFGHGGGRHYSRSYGNGHHRHGEVPIAGKYHIVYPVDPSYFDARDGQVYAAQGYGGPVSVPLAPVVNHTYNYGWGIPSSRLTPVLHPVTQAPISTMPGVYPSAPISY